MLKTTFHLCFCFLSLCFDVVDGLFLNFDHDTHFVEELSEFSYSTLNLLDILVSRLDFTQCRSRFSMTSRSHQLHCQPPTTETRTYSLRKDLSTLIIINRSLNLLLRSIRFNYNQLTPDGGEIPILSCLSILCRVRSR